MRNRVFEWKYLSALNKFYDQQIYQLIYQMSHKIIEYKWVFWALYTSIDKSRWDHLIKIVYVTCLHNGISKDGYNYYRSFLS